jgi:6-phosphogluconolactonase (cycloisomerase 2 family)
MRARKELDMFERVLSIRWGRALAAGAATGFLFLAAAAPSSAQGLAAGAVFTATNDAQANAVVAFHRDATGRLASQDIYRTGGRGSGGGLGNQGGLALNRSGRLLLAVNAGSDSVSVFRVGPRGLDLLDVARSAGPQPISVTIHGDLVYVLDAGGDGNIAGLQVAKDGTLSPLAGSLRPLSGVGTAPAQIAFSPDGRFLVVSEKATNTIVTYSVGSDGLPGDPVVTRSAGMTPFGFSFDNRSHLLVSEASGGAAGLSTVSSYDLLGDGSLVTITSALATTQSAACWLVTTPNGHYAYVTNTASNTVTGLDIARDGTVELLHPGGVSATSGVGPIDAAVSRNGRFLYVLNGADDTIDAYAIQADGSLSALSTTGGLPASVNGLAAL